MKKHDDITCYALLILLCLITIPALYIFIEPETGNDIPPRFWPTMAIGISLFFSVSAFINEYRQGIRINCRNIYNGLKKNKAQIIFVVIAIIYIKSINYAGFLLSSLVMLPLTMLFFGLKRKLLGIVISTVFVMAVYLIFQKIFKISFPLGILEVL